MNGEVVMNILSSNLTFIVVMATAFWVVLRIDPRRKDDKK